MNDHPGQSLLWESLVTDGHVRAARIRRALPWVLAFAALLMFVGWMLLSRIDRPSAQNSRSATLEAEKERQQNRAAEVFGGLARVRLRNAAEVQTLRSYDELGDLQARILQSLNRLDDFPANTVRAVEPAAFWRQPWAPREIVATEGSGVRLVGAVVRLGGAPVRWLGVFRQEGGEWQAVAVAGPGFVAPPNTEQVRVEDIPVTLGPVLVTGD